VSPVIGLKLASSAPDLLFTVGRKNRNAITMKFCLLFSMFCSLALSLPSQQGKHVNIEGEASVAGDVPFEEYMKGSPLMTSEDENVVEEYRFNDKEDIASKKRDDTYSPSIMESLVNDEANDFAEDRVSVKRSLNDCGDKHNKCEYWAGIGECTKNPGWMLKNCKTSCSDCNCADKHNRCAEWAQRGECRKNPGWMLFNCGKSCSRICKKSAPKPKPAPKPQPAPKPEVDTNVDNVLAACVADANKYRALHADTPPFVHDPELSRQAQQWANHLASIRQMKHSEDYERNNPKQGENLAYKGKWNGNGDAAPWTLMEACKNSHIAWYDEIKLYNGYSMGQAGHYTQMVWAPTTRVGFGFAVYDDHPYLSYQFVGRYAPPGNMYEMFSTHVHKCKNRARTCYPAGWVAPKGYGR